MPKAQEQVTMKGKPLTLAGSEVEEGQRAPDFTAIANDLSEVKLSNLLKQGKVILLTCVPSLDTSVCAMETRRFSKEIGRLGDKVQGVAISMDLPFAQKRWCAAEGISNIMTVSDYRDASFGKAWGMLIPDLRLLARAVFVVDRNGVITYKQVVPEITDEPDYNAALDAVKARIG